MDRKAAFLLCVLLAGMIWPMGRIWEMWHREPSVCPPCGGLSSRRPVADTGTCGYFVPMLNATCPRCGSLWWDSKAPERTWTDRALDFLPRSRYPTVFSEPRICAMEGIYSTHMVRR